MNTHLESHTARRLTIDSDIKENFREILGGHSEYNKEKEESDKMREVILVSSKTVTVYNFDSHNVSIYGTIRDGCILSRTASVFSGCSTLPSLLLLFNVILKHLYIPIGAPCLLFADVVTVHLTQLQTAMSNYALTAVIIAMKSDIYLRDYPRKNSLVDSAASNKRARKSSVITQVLLHDNQTKKPVVRNVSTQSPPAVHPT